MTTVNKKSLIFQFLVFTALLATLSTTLINLDLDNKLQKIFAQGEEENSFIKDKSILEKPNDDMVIVKEPLPDEDFVESGDAYLTISTIFKGN